MCNLGDAMYIFSGGILKSNLHRVVLVPCFTIQKSLLPVGPRPSPGAQSVLPRWSLAMFTRPSDTVILRALTEESAMVAEAVANAANKDVFNTGQTSKDWFARRIKYQRTKNQKVGCQLHAEWSRLTLPRRDRKLGVRAVARSTDLRLRS